ncbi:PAS domain S-box protein [candidate division KSB1 bacterium]
MSKQTYEELEKRVKKLEKLEADHNNTIKELKSSEERLKILFDYAPDAIYLHDLKGKFVDGNKAAEEMIGNKKEELINKNFLKLKLIPAGQIPKAIKNLLENAKGNPTGPDEFTLTRKDGGQVSLEIRTFPVKVKGKTLVLSIARDITQRKKSEEKLQESEEKYRLLIENIPSVAWKTNRKGQTSYISPNVEQVYGFTDKEIIEKGDQLWIKRIHPEDVEKVIRDFRLLFTKGKKYDVQYRIKRKDGKWIWLHDRAEKVIDTEDDQTSYGVFSDITDRKKAEEALRESEAKFKSYVTHSPYGIFVVDEKGRYIDANDASCKMTGYEFEELTKRSIKDLAAPGYIPDGIDPMANIKKTGFTQEEIKLKKKNGSIFTASLDAVRLAENRFMAFCTDITEKKQTEITLREEKEKAQNYLDIAGVMIVAINSDQKVTLINKKGCEILGYPEEDIVGKSWFDNFLPENLRKDVKKVFDMLVKGEMENIEYFENPILSKDGKIKIIAWHNTILKNNEGDIIGTLSSGEDITERKKTEETLKKERDLIVNITNTSPAGISVVNRNEEITYANYRAEQILCLKKDKMTHLTYNAPDWKITDFEGNLFPDEKLPFRIVKESGKSVFDIRHAIELPDGKRIFLSINASPLFDDQNKFDGLVSTIEDISDNIHSEKALRDSEAALQSIFRSAPIGIGLVKNRNFDWVNDKFCQISGYSHDELKGQNARIVYPSEEEYKRVGEEKYKEIKEKGIGTVETIFKRKNGTLTNILLSSSPIDMNDFSKGVTFTALDITERKKAEDEINKLASIVKHNQNFIGLSNLQGEVLYLNEAGSKMVGLDPEKILATNILDFVPDYYRETLINEVIPAVTKDGIWRGEGPLLNFKTSKIINVQTTVFLIMEKEIPKYIATVMVDITYRKKAELDKNKLEEQLFHAQKMESIGRLAGGVAHDFNNILGSIMAYSELLKMKYVDETTSEGKAADAIIRGVERAADLTKQLLGFARGGKYEPKPLNINQVINETIDMSEKIFEKDIELKLDLEEKTDNIEADRNQMIQIFTNIIINARDAMPRGGELIIKTENVFLDEDFVRTHAEFKPGNYVKISVTDSGIGMPKDIMDRIFEPFFSTKGEGKGTGLGLATVYGIVKNHYGHISCYSEQGEGTTFCVYLPVTGKKIEKTEKREKVFTGSETILVVDDEKDIRESTATLLKSLGYEVFTASDGQQALKIYEKNKNDIDLIIIDMIMPTLSGKETYLELKKINPDVQVILASGYSQNGKATDIINEGVQAFIQKPFRMHELSGLIRKLLSKETK